ncbi:mannosyltransferase family protein [Sutcliffiella sp. NPDC057660]|uniref:mannosyltransferase family protein n=1 Tax=Sutcliffiella sp. NPDC057660 TaxID=3346199 RepID=UPI0036ACB1B2
MSERKKMILFSLFLFVINKIVILIPAVYVHREILEESTLFSSIKFLFFDNFSKWDSGWYLSIVEEGYSLKGTAFFPLYPITIKLLSYVTNDPLMSGIIISNICFLLLIFFFMKLVRVDYSLKETYKITLLLSFFPTSFYFSALYTESMFMLFVILFLYFLRLQKWGLASLFGMFAGGTRNTGVLLAIPFAIEYLSNHFKLKNGMKLNKRFWGILKGAYIPLFAFIYMGYLWLEFGDPFSFSAVQSEYGRGFMAPWNTLIDGFQYHLQSIGKLLSGDFIYLDIYNVLELFFVTLILVTTILSYGKIRLSFWIIILYSILIPLTAPAYENVKDYFVSISRYALVIVPFYYALYEVFKRRIFYISLLTSFIILLMVLVYFWSLNYWVA